MTDYDSGKIQNGETKSDGVTTPAGRHLLSAFKHKESTWKHKINRKLAKCEFGVILSGDKVIDDKEFKQKLFAAHSRAIGGEMEGRGAYSACRRHNLNEWIIVKAICDWADGNKADDKVKRQSIAAKSAVSLLKHVFSDEKIFDKIYSSKNEAMDKNNDSILSVN